MKSKLRLMSKCIVLVENLEQIWNNKEIFVENQNFVSILVKISCVQISKWSCENVKKYFTVALGYHIAEYYFYKIIRVELKAEHLRSSFLRPQK